VSNKFKGSEILEVLIKIKENKIRFYKKIREESLKGVFQELIKEEEAHKLSLEQLKDIVGKFTPPEAYPGEYDLYLKALADENTKTLATIEVNEKTVATEEELLNISAALEKNALLFLYEMKNLVEDPGKKLIDQLIMQERNHLQKISELRKKVS
jgi:rubrerythrin